MKITVIQINYFSRQVNDLSSEIYGLSNENMKIKIT